MIYVIIFGIIFGYLPSVWCYYYLFSHLTQQRSRYFHTLERLRGGRKDPPQNLSYLPTDFKIVGVILFVSFTGCQPLRKASTL